MVAKDEALKMAIGVFDMYGNEMNSAFADEAYQSCKEALEQPHWVGLSDKEIFALCPYIDHDLLEEAFYKGARAIETKLKD